MKDYNNSGSGTIALIGKLALNTDILEATAQSLGRLFQVPIVLGKNENLRYPITKKYVVSDLCTSRYCRNLKFGMHMK